MLKMNCKICDKEFSYYPCEKTRSFCGRKCASKARIGISPPNKGKGKLRTITCQTCGNNFTINDWKTRKNAKFCSHKCKARQSSHEKSLGKRSFNGEGYEVIYLTSHPFSNNGYILYHRFLVERYLVKNNPSSDFLVKLGNNLFLDNQLHVHHINMIKTDNWLSNFYICTPSEHTKIHHKQVINLKPNFLSY